MIVSRNFAEFFGDLALRSQNDTFLLTIVISV